MPCGSAPGGAPRSGPGRRLWARADWEAQGRASGRPLDGPAPPAGGAARPGSPPTDPSYRAREAAGPAAAGQPFDPGGALPPSTAPPPASPGRGRRAIPAGRPATRPRPDPGSARDPDMRLSRRPPGPARRPAGPEWSCRSSRPRAGPWVRSAAIRPAPGCRPGPENRSAPPARPRGRALDPAVPRHRARPLDRHPVPAAGPPPGRLGPPYPSAELPLPSVPGGTRERPGRWAEGLPWDVNNRTDVLSVKPRTGRRGRV
jgi:hypothetical protein